MIVINKNYLYVAVTVLLSSQVQSAELTRDYCRNEANDNEVVLCIEQGVYDPCDDSSYYGSGKWTAQCAWAHLTIAEKSMESNKKEIIDRLEKLGTKQELIAQLELSQRKWKESRETYCKFSSSVLKEGFDGEPLAYCLKRVTQNRAHELQKLLNNQE